MEGSRLARGDGQGQRLTVQREWFEKDYYAVMTATLAEVWGRYKNELFEIWFDGGESNQPLNDIIHQMQPNAIVTCGDAGPNYARLVGSESGYSPYVSLPRPIKRPTNTLTPKPGSPWTLTKTARLVHQHAAYCLGQRQPYGRLFCARRGGHAHRHAGRLVLEAPAILPTAVGAKGSVPQHCWHQLGAGAGRAARQHGQHTRRPSGAAAGVCGGSRRVQQLHPGRAGKRAAACVWKRVTCDAIVTCFTCSDV